MQSMNEVMPKKYQLKRNGCVIRESNDLGTLQGQAKMEAEGYYQIVDTQTGEVLTLHESQNN